MAIKALVFDAYGTLFDTHSVASATEDAFPGHGEYVTQVWRQKQLEYSWLRTAMGRWSDFRAVTRDSLLYTAGTLGLSCDEATVQRLLGAFDRLAPYPEAREALLALKEHRLAILSNGSQAMLGALVGHSGLAHLLEAVISVDAKRVFKPHSAAYELIQERLGLPPREVAFVTSNGFDAAGAAGFGLKVVRIVRVAAETLRSELATEPVGPAAMFKALRTQQERLGFEPAAEAKSLLDLPGIARTL